METEIINKGNQTIANFMKLEKGDAWQVATEARDYTGFDALDFHYDWNNLMKVVDECVKQGCIFEFSHALVPHCRLWISEGKNRRAHSFQTGNDNITPIQCVWETVVQFCNWYNVFRAGKEKNKNDFKYFT